MSCIVIQASNTSEAWLKAVRRLLDCGGECFSLMVEIANPTQTEAAIHGAYEQLLADYGLLTVKKVVYTVFPVSLYNNPQVARNASRLFEAYNRKGGVFDRLQSRYPRKMGWGSYFRRLTHYPAVDKNGRVVTINQLERTIEMLRTRQRTHKAAYTLLIQIPGIDGSRTIGGPCLNYLALQLEKPRVLNCLAVYRNHDFIQRAYGNYLALGHLMQFLCDQTDYSLGRLSCLSSHASIKNLRGSRSWPSIREVEQATRELFNT
jgi:hypothetical protein